MKEMFQDLADDLINDTFIDFKEEFEFVIKNEVGEYNDETGDYDYSGENEFAYGIPVKISKDLLASGIYSSSDIKIIFKFSEYPIEADLGTRIKRLKDGKEYTIAEYIPDTADASVSILAKGV